MAAPSGAGAPDGWGVKVWRAWDNEWVADCFAHGELHWGGSWADAMTIAQLHFAIHHRSGFGADA